MTVHWLDATLERRSAMLCWRRLKGEHTYDVLAKAIHEVLKEFDISDKVVRITTDSGSNFRNAFRIFGVTGAQPSEPRQFTFDEIDAQVASKVRGITEEERELLRTRPPLVKLSKKVRTAHAHFIHRLLQAVHVEYVIFLPMLVVQFSEENTNFLTCTDCIDL